ncbi:MAG: F0F1 ATP synthase subunit A [Oscillospiraceae bacterium]|nr:F0F1 ATP synthase subunit A [Oscillospiraceae bacterium]
MKKAALILIITAFMFSMTAFVSFAEEKEKEPFGVEGAQIIVPIEAFGISSAADSFVSLNITASLTTQWVVMLILGTIFFLLGRNLKVKPETKTQAAAEAFVGFFTGMVNDAMGSKYIKYVPYIAVIFCFSMFNSLAGLLGMRAPTADISVVGTWGLITAFLVLRNKFKTGGFWGPFKSLLEPVIPMAPINLIGEITNPLTQSFRHFGNILAGTIIMGIIYWALGAFAMFIPLPAVLSMYFDIFGAVVQAYIFSTLTMVYVLMADRSPDNA